MNETVGEYTHPTGQPEKTITPLWRGARAVNSTAEALRRGELEDAPFICIAIIADQ